MNRSNATPACPELLRALPLLAALTGLAACHADEAFDRSDSPADETGFEGDGDGDFDTDTDEPGDGDPGDGDPGDGDPGGPPCPLDCGPGECVAIALEYYCECPEGTQWAAQGCEPCPLVDAADHPIDLVHVDFSGGFVVAGEPTPGIEYDDANIWLENSRTGDRVLVGNTHELSFQLRVTPGIYAIVYEVESPGPVLPHNPRVELGTIALFESRAADIEIPVARVSGDFVLDGVAPPAVEYDDANVYLRDPRSGGEVLAGNTHEGSYAVAVVPGEYEVVYRVESPGEEVPRNDGAVLELRTVNAGVTQHDISITSTRMQGEFRIAGVAAPGSEYEDANIMLESLTGGTVSLGNTHDGTYDVNVIPGSYGVVYLHETGASVPQNQRARFVEIQVEPGGSPDLIDVPVVTIAGTMSINGAAPPMTEFDDGVLFLSDPATGDVAMLGNTHDGAYQIDVIPGTYDVYYAQETAGGTVPQNKRARVLAGLDIEADASVDVDVPAVSIAGTLTFDGAQPPASVYEDGRVYLRNTQTDDALLLGSTHAASYAAVVVPGDYELVYAQEAGGEVPSNQSAALGAVSILGSMTYDVDVPVVDLAGAVIVDGMPAPASASDGGQLYLRSVDGDSVLLGNSFDPGFATRLVAGVYGVYYRSAAAVTTPANANGRIACIAVE